MAKRDLVHRFIWFLQNELESGCLSEEAAEGIEVARQCLESAYEIKEVDEIQNRPTMLEIYAAGLALCTDIVRRMAVRKESQLFLDVILIKEEGKEIHRIFHDLPDNIFRNLSERDPEHVRHPEPTEEEKIRADKLKDQGNLCMAKCQFQEAVDCYSKAIELNSLNAVYYSNRAAAYSKLNEHSEAIKNCEMAIKINSQYSKAYARMGLAYSAMNNHTKAVEAYENALKIDPVNQGYQQNLSLAQQRLQGQEGAASSSTGGPEGPAAAPNLPGGIPGAPGSFDFSSFLNNPALMNMASQLMGSPEIQNIMSNLMSGAMNEGGANSPNMENILSMGQRIAQQMQAHDPDLVENLREQYQQQQTTNGNNSAAEPDSDDKSNPDRTDVS